MLILCQKTIGALRTPVYVSHFRNLITWDVTKNSHGRDTGLLYRLYLNKVLILITFIYVEFHVSKVWRDNLPPHQAFLPLDLLRKFNASRLLVCTSLVDRFLLFLILCDGRHMYLGQRFDFEEALQLVHDIVLSFHSGSLHDLSVLLKKLFLCGLVRVNNQSLRLFLILMKLIRMSESSLFFI